MPKSTRRLAALLGDKVEMTNEETFDALLGKREFRFLLRLLFQMTNEVRELKGQQRVSAQLFLNAVRAQFGGRVE